MHTEDDDVAEIMAEAGMGVLGPGMRDPRVTGILEELDELRRGVRFLGRVVAFQAFVIVTLCWVAYVVWSTP